MFNRVRVLHLNRSGLDDIALTECKNKYLTSYLVTVLVCDIGENFEWYQIDPGMMVKEVT